MKKSLTKKQILRLRTDIARVFCSGKAHTVRNLKIIVSLNDFTYSRFIIIPVRHYGNSVKRNYIRKQLKELWRINQDRIEKGYDCAIVVSKCTNTDFSELQDNFIALLKKSGIYE